MTGPTILLVEDSDSLRILLKDILEGAGYEVLPSVGAMSAVEYLGMHKGIDLIVTDYRIPSIDGSAWLKFLSRFIHPRIKIGTMSSYCIDPMGFPFLEKPFSRERFLEFVESILDSGNETE